MLQKSKNMKKSDQRKLICIVVCRYIIFYIYQYHDVYIYIYNYNQPTSVKFTQKKTCQDHFFKTCSIASREFLVNFFREICCILFLLKMALACDACLLPRSSANLKIQQNQERWLVACSLRLRGNIWGAS